MLKGRIEKFLYQYFDWSFIPKKVVFELAERTQNSYFYHFFIQLLHFFSAGLLLIIPDINHILQDYFNSDIILLNFL